MRTLILLALFGTALAVPKQSNRIVGGSPTTIEAYPYMSAMEHAWFGIIWYQACGGSLITNTAVLSAAHCYYGDAPNEWRVRLGSSRPETGGSVHQVSRLVLHERYNDVTLNYDVAIVRLSTPAVYSASVAPARVAGAGYNLPAGTPVTAIGWGTLWSDGPSPDILQHVDINIISQDICAERYANLKTQPGYQNVPDITYNMLCAGILDVGGKDACQGDSGGPIAHDRDVVVGITSWGLGCAHEYYPGVNARVSAVVDWIVANAA